MRKKYVGLTLGEIEDLRLSLHYLATADKAIQSYQPDDEIANRLGRFAALDAKLIAAEIRLEMIENF